ncbi:Hypothetical predicted protein [Octopus vulgaris]|uniref:Uncharacterized protein n=1 Tax=Octopus vulgaris TaxID=6645 RepID=A0AA36AEZ7_OCTVU|nr:Hypothetical predicted protein [Octopus vulgaris]
MNIAEEDISPSREFVAKLNDIQVPKSKEDIDKIVHLTNYYRRFVSAHSEKVKPLLSARSKEFQSDYVMDIDIMKEKSLMIEIEIM